MSLKKLAALASAIVLFAGSAHAQITGEIYGKAADKSGAIVPGVTVTLTSPVLIQPQSAVTGATGVYRFPAIPIGVYTVKFELAGFTTVVRDQIRLEIGQNAQINATLDVSAMQEVVTITGEAPLIDTRNNGRISSFNQEALQNVPSARDPWVIMQQSAGIIIDRENIGGNMSGQQSGYVARGTPSNQSKWNLDGIDITDMAATGASPVYYDFDAFEEMQISTGGADVTMQSPGVGINLVTKSGTDKFKGSARYYYTDDKYQSTNINDTLRRQGATSGNPIQNIKDWGGEMGGPIVKGKVWAWGSYGTQDIKVGVNNFFLKTGACTGITPANAATFPFETVKDCLNTDLTTLKTYNAKLAYQVSSNTHFSLFFNAAEKVRNARDSSDLRPIETAYRQGAVIDETLGSKLWKIGIPKTYKASLRRVFSDRFMMEFQYAHIGNNFTLDFQEPALAEVQPTQELATGLWGRSFQASNFVRPTNSFDLTGTRSSSGFMGGDHALKFGVRYRQDRAISRNHRGGNVEARWRDANGDRLFQPSEASEANMYRDSFTDYNVFNTSAYIQDTFTKGKLTIMAGIRLDRQWDRANASVAPAHPFFGQATATGANFNHLPALNFAGADPGVKFIDIVPRLGINYDLSGDGKNIIKFNLARYANQLGDGDLAGTLNPVQASFIRFPWRDTNGDLKVQANEITITGTPLNFGGNYSPTNPTSLSSPGTVDTGLTNEHTDEAILEFNKQLGNSFAFGVAGIYRKVSNLRWNDTTNWTEANYRAVNFQAPSSGSGACVAAQNPTCPAITYYEPTSAVPAAYVYTNRPNIDRTYLGFEITARKRMANGLTMNGSFTLNDTQVNYGAGSFEDPTNIANLDGAEYAPESAGSGIGNVFQNATYLARMQASYTVPWQQIMVSAAFNARSGFPLPLQIQTPSRANGGGIATVYLAPLGETRLPNYSNLDLGVNKPVRIGRAKITLSVDLFNILNGNIIQARQRTQNSTIANNIQALVAPRVARFGARLNW